MSLTAMFPFGVPPPPEGECDLLSGPAAWATQLVLGVAVAAGLALERWRERPRRPANVWGLDVGKQGVGALVAHAAGMAWAIALAAGFGWGADEAAKRARSGGEPEPSPCAWYAVVFTLDTTVGAFLCVLMHAGCVRLAKRWVARRVAEMREEAARAERSVELEAGDAEAGAGADGGGGEVEGRDADDVQPLIAGGVGGKGARGAAPGALFGAGGDAGLRAGPFVNPLLADGPSALGAAKKLDATPQTPRDVLAASLGSSAPSGALSGALASRPSHEGRFGGASSASLGASPAHSVPTRASSAAFGASPAGSDGVFAALGPMEGDETPTGTGAPLPSSSTLASAGAPPPSSWAPASAGAPPPSSWTPADLLATSRRLSRRFSGNARATWEGGRRTGARGGAEARREAVAGVGSARAGGLVPRSSGSSPLLISPEVSEEELSDGGERRARGGEGAVEGGGDGRAGKRRGAALGSRGKRWHGGTLAGGEAGERAGGAEANEKSGRVAIASKAGGKLPSGAFPSKAGGKLPSGAFSSKAEGKLPGDRSAGRSSSGSDEAISTVPVASVSSTGLPAAVDRAPSFPPTLAAEGLRRAASAFSPSPRRREEGTYLSRLRAGDGLAGAPGAVSAPADEVSASFSAALGSFSHPSPLARSARRGHLWVVSVAHCGEYGSPPRLALWLPQCLLWSLCVAVSHLLCGAGVAAAYDALDAAAAGIDAFFAGNWGLERATVVVLGPVLLNVAQAVVQDIILKAGRKKRGIEADTADLPSGGVRGWENV